MYIAFKSKRPPRYENLQLDTSNVFSLFGSLAYKVEATVPMKLSDNLLLDIFKNSRSPWLMSWLSSSPYSSEHMLISFDEILRLTSLDDIAPDIK